MMFKIFAAVLPFYLCFSFVTPATKTVTCYYESWASGSFAPEDIDVNICTHINFSFLGINNDGSFRLDGGDGLLKRLSALKKRNPNVKLLISVGGWDEGSEKFSHVAANAAAKSSMAHSVLYYMQTYNFDGVDIDWEFPGQRGGTKADKENFIDMLWVIRNLLNENGGGLITVAVSSECDGTNTYNVPAMSKVVDAINVMTYDFHGAGEGKTGQNSPLYAAPGDSDWQIHNSNCDASINNWLKAGADPQKLMLGLAFYGHTFRLSNPSNHGVHAPCKGEGISGGYIGYSEICKLKGWTEVFDNNQKVPYRYQNDQWIGYDNPKSIGLKVQYAKSKNLKGVFMWAIDNDDKNGACGAKNPMLNAIKNNL